MGTFPRALDENIPRVTPPHQVVRLNIAVNNVLRLMSPLKISDNLAHLIVSVSPWNLFSRRGGGSRMHSAPASLVRKRENVEKSKGRKEATGARSRSHRYRVGSPEQ